MVDTGMCGGDVSGSNGSHSACNTTATTATAVASALEGPYAIPVEVLIDQQCARLAAHLSLDERNPSTSPTFSSSVIPAQPTASDLLTPRPLSLLNVELAWRRVTIGCNMCVVELTVRAVRCESVRLRVSAGKLEEL
jgi:hypothetical protein